jgi:hypothetical protein
MRYTFRDPPMPLTADALERVLDADPLHVPPDEIGNLSAGLDTEPPHERKFDSGNKRWCATLPPGNYEISEEPDADEMLAVHRVDDGGRELVLKLPSADYVAEDDEAGMMHIYAVPEGENAARLLNGQTSDANIETRRGGEMATLVRLNKFHRARAWDRPTADRSPLATDPTLRALNEANRRRWGDSNDAA